MSDEEDVRKLTEVINEQKLGNFQNQFENFLVGDEEEDEDSDYEESEEENEDENAPSTSVLPMEDVFIQPENIKLEIPVLKFPEITTGEDFSELSLKASEKSVIDACQNPDLKRLLMLNRSKYFQLLKFAKKVNDLLSECQASINTKETSKVVVKRTSDRMYQPFKLAAPYFKTKNCRTCPPNEDTLRKRRNQELSLYELSASPKWSHYECEQLIRSVKLSFNINKQTDLKKKIARMRTALTKKQEALADVVVKKELDDDDDIYEICVLEEELQRLENCDASDIPELDSDEFIDWHRVAEMFLKDKHTANECKQFWHLYLHPQINKSPWTKEENDQIVTLANFYDYQNWDTIATQLGTNRTGFSICLHYYSNLVQKFKKCKFSREEDELLVKAVEKVKIGSYIPWNAVEHFFMDRSRIQLFTRYHYLVEHVNITRGHFTEAEDILLLILFNKFGKRFKKYVSFMPHRSYQQIKSRYSCNLCFEIRKGSFTTEDDILIMSYAESPSFKNWARLTHVLQRSRSQLRQRYGYMRQYLDEHPDKTIADIPKRKHQISNETDQYQFLRTMADKYISQNKIPTLKEIQDMLGIKSSDVSVYGDVKRKIHKGYTHDMDEADSMLIEYFSHSYKLKNKQNVLTFRQTSDATQNVQEILTILEAELSLPDYFIEGNTLDHVDVEILRKLSTATTASEIIPNRLLPPNINSVVGLTSLLLRNSANKTRHKEKCNILQECGMPSHPQNAIMLNDIQASIDNVPEQHSSSLKNDLDLFYHRFQSIFTWPSVLTLQPPSERLINTELGNLEPEKPLETTKRRNDVLDLRKSPPKRLKLAPQQELTSAHAQAVATAQAHLKMHPIQSPVAPILVDPSKLKRVDKSVIESMLRKNPKMRVVKFTQHPDQLGTSIGHLNDSKSNNLVNEVPKAKPCTVTSSTKVKNEPKQPKVIKIETLAETIPNIANTSVKQIVTLPTKVSKIYKASKSTKMTKVQPAVSIPQNTTTINVNIVNGKIVPQKTYASSAKAREKSNLIKVINIKKEVPCVQLKVEPVDVTENARKNECIENDVELLNEIIKYENASH